MDFVAIDDAILGVKIVGQGRFGIFCEIRHIFVKFLLQKLKILYLSCMVSALSHIFNVSLKNVEEATELESFRSGKWSVSLKCSFRLVFFCLFFIFH